MSVDSTTGQAVYDESRFRVADVPCVIQCEMRKVDAVMKATDDSQRLRVISPIL